MMMTTTMMMMMMMMMALCVVPHDPHQASKKSWGLAMAVGHYSFTNWLECYINEVGREAHIQMISHDTGTIDRRPACREEPHSQRPVQSSSPP
jgi:hypothetical protein